MRCPLLAVRALAIAVVPVLPKCGYGQANTLFRGVGPVDEDRYSKFSATVADGVFRCLDGSETTLPSAAFNDDFCDCADGSDEPGTGACAGVIPEAADKVLFYCPNNHSQPKYVYRSRVNDGVCDCCDGSDEQRPASPTHCKDTCWQEGFDHREEERRLLEDWQKGTKLQSELVEAAEAKLGEWQVEAEKLRDMLPTLKSDREEKKKVLEEARKHLPPPTTTTTTTLPPPTTTTTPPPTPEEVAWTEAARTLEAAKGRLKQLEAKLDPVLVGGRRALAKLGNQCLNHKDDKKFEYKICFFASAHQSTDTEKDVLLGVWSGWDVSVDAAGLEIVRARFEDGLKCGDGKARSMRVRFECGNKVRIKHITEPKSCEYEASVYHPGGCDPTKVPKDENRIEAWKGIIALQEEQAAAVEKESSIWSTDAEGLRAELRTLEGDAAEKKKLLEASQEAQNKVDESSQAAPVVADGETPAVSEYAKWMEAESLPGGVRTDDEVEALIDFANPNGETIRKGERGRVLGPAEEASKVQVRFPSIASVDLNPSQFAKVVKGDSDASQQAAGEKPQVSEYAKWMEGAGNDAPSSAAADVDAGQTATTTEEPSVEPPVADEKEDPAQIAFNAAQDAWSASDAEFWKAKYRLKGLEVGLDPQMAGKQRAFTSLDGQCLEKSFEDKRYKVCFFRTAHYYSGSSPEEVSLGRWMGWDFKSSPIQARFQRGASCEADGVANLRKSLLVSFKCGPEAQIESAESRSACAFEMQVSHPGACDPERPPEKQIRPPRLPKDEL